MTNRFISQAMTLDSKYGCIIGEEKKEQKIVASLQVYPKKFQNVLFKILKDDCKLKIATWKTGSYCREQVNSS